MSDLSRTPESQSALRTTPAISPLLLGTKRPSVEATESEVGSLSGRQQPKYDDYIADGYNSDRRHSGVYTGHPNYPPKFFEDLEQNPIFSSSRSLLERTTGEDSMAASPTEPATGLRYATSAENVEKTLDHPQIEATITHDEATVAGLRAKLAEQIVENCLLRLENQAQTNEIHRLKTLIKEFVLLPWKMSQGTT